MNVLVAMELVLKLLESVMVAGAKLKSTIEKARSEGRDISNEELEALRAESNAALENLKSKVSS